MRNVFVVLVLAALVVACVPATSQAGLIFHRHDNCCCGGYGYGNGYGGNGCCNNYGGGNCGCNNGGGYAYNSGCGCGYGGGYGNGGQYMSPGYVGQPAAGYYGNGQYIAPTQAGYAPYIRNGSEPMPKDAPNAPTNNGSTNNSGTTNPGTSGTGTSGSGTTPPSNPPK